MPTADARGRSPNRREPTLAQVLGMRATQRAQTLRSASRYGPPRVSMAGSPLSVATYVHRPGAVVVALSGEVDNVTGPLIGTAIAQQLRGAPELVIVELTRVTKLTSAGVDQLVSARLDGEVLRFDLVLVAPSDVALRALAESGSAEHFVIHATIDEALRG